MRGWKILKNGENWSEGYPTKAQATLKKIGLDKYDKENKYEVEEMTQEEIDSFNWIVMTEKEKYERDEMYKFVYKYETGEMMYGEATIYAQSTEKANTKAKKLLGDKDYWLIEIEEVYQGEIECKDQVMI